MKFAYKVRTFKQCIDVMPDTYTHRDLRTLFECPDIIDTFHDFYVTGCIFSSESYTLESNLH